MNNKWSLLLLGPMFASGGYLGSGIAEIVSGNIGLGIWRVVAAIVAAACIFVYVFKVDQSEKDDKR